MSNLSHHTNITFLSHDNYVLASRIRRALKKLDYEVSYCNQVNDLIAQMLNNRYTIVFLDKEYLSFAKFLSQLLLSDLEIIENVRFVFIDDEVGKYLKYVNNKNFFNIPETNFEVALTNVVTQCEMLNLKSDSISSSKVNYNEIISDILTNLGFSYKLVGFRYIKLCMEYAIKNHFSLGSLSKDVFQYVAMQNCTTISNVERGIRTSIENASKSETFKKENISGDINKNVSNKMFLEYLLDKIIIYKNKQN